ncbi:CHAT domain-containing protein [Parafrankia irregularis]|uniref:CHAT domain-containing protein n=1 Tax=Parafrankia irregularis TaxID=795642 RepID=A0A0S4QJU6_9ACTN|nr:MULTISPECIES: CHAT domain-containing protein [Parafrankia]MBE3205725.1 CHAT domain-containing protein [Parafrankia sp. CH37]CUU55375.1 CHAT domain-containing protein [Parafrankia irregularis]
MREQLLAQVGARIAKFTADRNVDLVLDPAALDEVSSLLAVAARPGPDLEVLSLAGWLHWFRYLSLDAGDDQNDLRLAVILFEEVYRVRPEAVPTRIGNLMDGLGNGGSDEGERYYIQGFAAFQQSVNSRGIALAGIAADWLRRSVAATPSGHAERARRLSVLGLALQSLFELAWSAELGWWAEDLDEAITVGRDAVTATSLDDHNRARRLSDLGIALWARYDMAKSMKDLDETIAVRRDAVTATSLDDHERAGRLSNLGISLQKRYEVAKSAKDLDEAIGASRDAVATASLDHPLRAEFLSNLGFALRSQYRRTGSVEDLDGAVSAFRDAEAAIPADNPEWLRYSADLGLALQARFERTGSSNDLEETVGICREVAAAASEDHPDRASFLSHLGVALQLHFDQEGSIQDLEEAIVVSRDAVKAVPVGHPDRTMYLMNLGLAMESRYVRTGSLVDLDNSIVILRKAATAAVSASLDSAMYLSNLALALRVRFERRGSIEDLEEAVIACREAVAATSAHHSDRAMRLSNLSVALQLRFMREKSIGDLEEAVTVGRQAVADIPTDHPNRRAILVNFEVALRLRFQNDGSAEDLEESIAVGRDAVAAVRVDDPNRGKYLANLGSDLLVRFKRFKSIADINGAIHLLREAVTAAPADHPDRTLCLSNLALALQDRFDAIGSFDDLDAAIVAGREGTHSTTATTRLRVRAAMRWGTSAAKREMWDEAVRAYESAIGLLGELVPRDLGRVDQESLLEVIASIGVDAAACAVRANQPGRAVELFEQGRGVLLGHALDDRMELTSLDRTHPDLARRYVELRDLLDFPAGSGAGDRLSEGSGKMSESREAVGRRRRAQRADLDRLITRIRRCDGFGAFLASPGIAELAAAAHGGPVVVVTVSEFKSYALIVTTGGVEDTVELAEMTPDIVFSHVSPFVGALEVIRSGKASLKEKVAAENRIARTLQWMWDSLAGPIVELLESRDLLGDDSRVWWCLSGFLSFLPVHAAGYHGTRSDATPLTVMDRTVSSYTPTLRTLIYARRDRAVENTFDGPRHRVLVAAMPTTPGASPLPGVAREVAALADRFSGRVLVRQGPEVTFKKICDLLPGTEWVHFACHGASYLDRPSDSHLLFQDHEQRPFTVADVARLRLDHAGLAYLSACSTARPSGRLTDEAINLASAFQLAGYRHVIGTLWPVSDNISAWLTGEIYAALTRSRPASPAAAVHAATKRLRNEYPDHPSLWSSHMHIGS